MLVGAFGASTLILAYAAEFPWRPLRRVYIARLHRDRVPIATLRDRFKINAYNPPTRQEARGVDASFTDLGARSMYKG